MDVTLDLSFALCARVRGVEPSEQALNHVIVLVGPTLRLVLLVVGVQLGAKHEIVNGSFRLLLVFTSCPRDLLTHMKHSI